MLPAIGREHPTSEVATVCDERGWTMPMAADPERAIFGTYAESGIARAYVIGTDGKVVHQSLGYTPPRFTEVVIAVRTAPERRAHGSKVEPRDVGRRLSVKRSG